MTQLTPGPLGVGSRLRDVHKVLGRRRVEITEFVVFSDHDPTPAPPTRPPQHNAA